MRIVFIALGVLVLYGCATFNKGKKTNGNSITINGKIWETYGQEAGVVFTPERYLVLTGNNPRKIKDWPDSLRYQYVKVTGILKENKLKCDTVNSHKMQGYVKYFITNAQVELINDDSTICAIDSALGRCVEMRRFVNRLQIDRVLDSLVEGNEINLIVEDNIKVTARFFTHKGSKTIFIYNDLITTRKMPEYFTLERFPCDKNSEYNVVLTLVRKDGNVTTKREYILTGNHTKIYINLL